jgi:ABC-2 type transport system ATP-binding protein
MRILTGYLPATEGRARVGGFDVFDQPIEAKRRTGYLPETPPLYPEMTVGEYLHFVARINGIAAGDRAAQVGAAMLRTSITDMGERYCGTLSKGYRQRVGLAQALLHNPDVLILDEPTAGLDPRQIIETRRLITELAGDHTVILSTHILPEVSQTCQRVVIINRGKVVAVDSPGNLTARLQGSQSLYLQVDGGGDDPEPALRKVDGVAAVSVADQRDGVSGFQIEIAPGHDVRREVSRTVVTNGWGLLELRAQQMSLEDIFLQLTTEEAAGEADAPAPGDDPAVESGGGTPEGADTIEAEEHTNG